MQKEVPTRQQAGPPGVQDQVWAKEQDRGLTSMSVTVQVIVIKETPRERVEERRGPRTGLCLKKSRI